VSGDSPAAVELDVLLGDPALAGRWPGGFTGDDVLDELTSLGVIGLDVRDGRDGARFVCRLALRDGGAGAISGAGRSLTAAALRCLIDAEAELAAEVARGLRSLGRLLEGA
jgi:hypothetical protein